MYFLIDYENVRNGGMMGTEYLQPADHIIVFYSAAAPNMEAKHLTEIKASGCKFEVCRLIKTRKNGLDFYIGTKAGAIFGAGYQGNLVIISRDEGFQAVREYWANCAKPARRVLTSESIERGIVSANEPDQRTALVRQQLKSTDIGQFFSAYEEGLRLRKLLEDAFSGTEFSARTAEMEDILKTGKTPKVIYLDTLHRFGRKDGLAVYKMLKSCAEF